MRSKIRLIIIMKKDLLNKAGHFESNRKQGEENKSRTIRY